MNDDLESSSLSCGGWPIIGEFVFDLGLLEDICNLISGLSCLQEASICERRIIGSW